MQQMYHIARGQQQLAVVDKADLISRVQSGVLQPADLYWTAGMPSWKPLSTFGMLAPYWGGGRQLHAGSPTPVAVAHVQPALPPRREGAPDCCPNCGNKNVKSAQHLYLVGTRDSTTTGTSMGWGRRSSPRSWVSSRTSKSRLAAELAPPQKGCGLAFLGALFALALPMGCIASSFSGHGRDPSPVGMFLGLAVGIFLAVWVYRWMSQSDEQSEREHQRKMDEWERTWYCNKCSHRFLW